MTASSLLSPDGNSAISEVSFWYFSDIPARLPWGATGEQGDGKRFGRLLRL